MSIDVLTVSRLIFGERFGKRGIEEEFGEVSFGSYTSHQREHLLWANCSSVLSASVCIFIYYRFVRGGWRWMPWQHLFPAFVFLSLPYLIFFATAILLPCFRKNITSRLISIFWIKIQLEKSNLVLVAYGAETECVHQTYSCWMHRHRDVLAKCRGSSGAKLPRLHPSQLGRVISCWWMYAKDRKISII